MKRKGFTLIELLIVIAIIGILVAIAFGYANAMASRPSEPVSNTGVTMQTAKIKTGADGLTVEQRNVKERLEAENDPGSIKHLYIISAYSGQAIMYSTVKGKVTSSGKRLSPYTVTSNQANAREGFNFYVDGARYITPEVLQDDGTYGSSIPYLFWWDSAGRYHQHYVSGGQIVHISDQPINVKGVIIRIEN